MMMGKEKVYKILVKDCSNEYILGRISGILRGANGDENWEFAQQGFPYSPKLRILRVKTTYWKYRKMKNRIETDYPGMCVFM